MSPEQLVTALAPQCLGVCRVACAAHLAADLSHLPAPIGSEQRLDLLAWPAVVIELDS